MPEREFDIECGRQMGEGGGLSVRVIDRVSRETLADFRLTAEEVWRLTGGGSIHIRGHQSNHLERVGRRMVNDSLGVPRGLTQYPMPREEQLATGREWAQREAPGWETYEPRHTNQGVQVIMRKWIDPE